MTIEKEAWVQHLSVRPIKIDRPRLRRIAQELTDQLRDALLQLEPQMSLRDRWETLGAGIFQASTAYENWKTVDGRSRMVMVNLRQLKNEEVAEPFVIGGEFDAGTGWVTIELNENTPTQLYLKYLPQIESQIYNTLVHEFTHVQDVIPPGDLDQWSLSNEEYYNSPEEVRAYMAEIGEQVIEALDHTLPPQEAFRQALSQSKSWVNISRYLTPENRKKITQGVFRHVQDFLLE